MTVLSVRTVKNNLNFFTRWGRYSAPHNKGL